MKKITALFLTAILFFSMTACGKEQNTEPGNTGSDLVYVPEYFDLGEEGDILLQQDALFDKDMLCHPVITWNEEKLAYQIVLHRHSLTQGTLVELPLQDGAVGISAWTLGVDNSMYFVVFGWSSEEAAEVSSASTVLVKYGRSGNLNYWRDITELLPDEDAYLLRIAVDDKNRAYLLTEKGVLLFDGDGNPSGTVNMSVSNNIYFGSFGRGSDGKVYLSGTANNGPDDAATLYQVDYEAVKLGAGHGDFPSAGGSLAQDAVGNIVTYDSTALYTYNLDTDEKEQLLDWVDSGINPSAVNTVGVLSDGRIAVFCQDWQIKEHSVALLSGVDVAEIPKKEEIVIAQLYPNPDMPAAATIFNRESDSYHVTVKNYLSNFSTSSEEVEAAITRLVADIISGNGPDILSPGGLENQMEELVSMGAFEDLNPYLDQSSVLDREDMIESVLNAQTYDGVLVSLPASFDIYTYFGNSAIVGGEMGWSYKDVIALLKANPGSALDDGIDRTRTLSFCMDINDFVDWETATCSFDCDEFKDLLEFVAQLSMPEESVFNSDGWPLLMEKLKSGDILLLFAGISSFTDIQVVQEKFQGDVTAIGLPTTDGSFKGHLLVQSSAMMLSSSDVKKGAWEFIECYFIKGDERYRYGFPNSWSKLEEMITKELEQRLDFSGNPVFDENGDPVPANRVGYTFGDYHFDTHFPTQEEIDLVLDLIRSGSNTDSSEREAMLRQIVNEEAEAFFRGQKTVDQVAETIQRRASIYVSENS